MKLTSKTRYGCAVMVMLAKANRQTLPLSQIAERLGISKIYLEQVLSVLRSHQLVSAQKGPMGGYRLEGQPDLWTILSALEPELLALPEHDFTDERMNQVLQETLYQPILSALQSTLLPLRITSMAEHYTDAPMYYI